MNACAAEIGLRIVDLRLDLKHISGVSNYEADALSRLFAGKSIPPHLAGVRRANAPERNAEFFAAWPKELV